MVIDHKSDIVWSFMGHKKTRQRIIKVNGLNGQRIIKVNGLNGTAGMIIGRVEMTVETYKSIDDIKKLILYHVNEHRDFWVDHIAQKYSLILDDVITACDQLEREGYIVDKSSGYVAILGAKNYEGVSDGTKKYDSISDDLNGEKLSDLVETVKNKLIICNCFTDRISSREKLLTDFFDIVSELVDEGIYK